MRRPMSYRVQPRPRGGACPPRAADRAGDRRRARPGRLLVRSDSGLLSADLRATHGFSVTIRSARNGYIDVRRRQREQLGVGTRCLRRDHLLDGQGTRGRSMLARTCVPIVGAGAGRPRPEDAAFSFNAETRCCCPRFGGRAVKHNRPRFWDLYDFADAAAAGLARRTGATVTPWPCDCPARPAGGRSPRPCSARAWPCSTPPSSTSRCPASARTWTPPSPVYSG